MISTAFSHCAPLVGRGSGGGGGGGSGGGSGRDRRHGRRAEKNRGVYRERFSPESVQGVTPYVNRG